MPLRALETSLNKANLLAGSESSSQYELTATMDNLRQPAIRISMTVSAKIHYTLTHNSSNKKVFEKTIDLPYTAAFNAAFRGTERLRLANEGAIRVNIEELIRQLMALKVTNIEL